MNNRIGHRRLVAAALAVVLLGGCAGSPTQESTGEYLDDTAVKDDPALRPWVYDEL